MSQLRDDPDVLTCPDCGGVLTGDAGGRKACTCFAPSSPKPAARTSATDHLDESLSGDELTSSVSSGPKVCKVCGKKLDGKKRFRDGRGGYFCSKCNKADDAQRRAEKEKQAAESDDPTLVRCPECGRKVKPLSMVRFKGVLICRRCQLDKAETDRVKVRKVDFSGYQWHERRKVIVWAAVVGGLVALGVLVNVLT